jgi:hypothetical protein
MKAALGSMVPDLNIGCFVDENKCIHWHCKKVDQVLLLFLDILGKLDMSNFDHIDIPFQSTMVRGSCEHL